MGERLKLTKTQALLEEARSRLGGVTDYKLAKVMEVHRQQMSRYHKGDQQADAYACAKIALILERDPLEVIAEVEADAAKTDARRAFWVGFPSGLRRTALGVALSMTFGSSALVPRTGEARSPDPGSHNVRLRKRQRQEIAALKGGFFWPFISPKPAGKAGTAPAKNTLARHPLIFPATTFTMQPRLAFL